MFSEKTIRISVQLREGEFSGGNNLVIIEGLPTSCTITKQGGAEKNKADVVIQNIKLDTVKALTTLAFKRLQTFNNIIQIDAGDAGNTQLATIFIGEISTAVPEIADDGNLNLKIEAIAGYYANLKPTAPTSVQGETTIEDLMKQFAEEAEYDFENKGVTGSVRNCVFVGSPIKKAQTLARQTGIDLLINDKKFIIQPFEAPKEGEIPVIAPYSGLLGYPTFTNDGITCKTIFCPLFEVGTWMKVESVLPFATGEYQIVKIEHKLEAYMPNGGNWFTEVSGVVPYA